MDSGQKSQNSDNSKRDGSPALHLHEKESVRSPDDILVRRLKNRERQRRYRARKRHEADLKKASIADQSSPLHYQPQPAEELLSVPVEVEVSLNLTSPDYLTRFHCQRDWKKDARRAHVQKKQEASTVVHSNSELTTPGGSSATFLESDVIAGIQPNHSNTSILDNNAMHKSQSSRRHWKAEARNRKCSE